MNINKHLILSGIIFTIVLYSWPILMGLYLPSGSVDEQLNWVISNKGLYKLQFFMAFLIAPALVYMMLAQVHKIEPVINIVISLGHIFLTAYLILCSISYASQVIVVPSLLDAGLDEYAKLWYFDSNFSIPYFINQMGYCFWAIGTIFIFIRFIKYEGIIKYISLIYLISAVLSIVAFIGLMTNNIFLNSMTFYSGIALVPIGIMTAVWGYRDKKNEKHLSEY